MSIALHGNLRDFGIGEVFQLIGQQRKTGVLQVRGSLGEVELRFDDGRVVSASPVGAYEDEALGDMAVRCGALPGERHAAAERARSGAGDALRRHLVDAGLAPAALDEVEDLLTRETLFALLRWDDGSFRFSAQPIPHDRPREALIAAEQVLMDGLRMVDEWSALLGELPAETLVFRRRGSLEEYRRSPAGRSSPWPAEAEQLFLLVDGRAPVRRVIDLSRLGTFAGMRIFVELERSGWIEPLRDEAAGGAREHRPAGRAWLGAVRVAPFALLVLLAAVALAGRTPAVPGVAIAHDPLAAASASWEAERVRHLALAAGLARGRPPASLAELPAWPDGDGTALTAEEAAAYHVAHRDGGILVLAPER
ncbi:MAG: DUF4388 domain-containing protein [Deltaproteobacteria bacterium]|nr:DUF4388 domain-containing protein [Deltaproteobacteria bacterium]